jgi:hypothetical protein
VLLFPGPRYLQLDSDEKEAQEKALEAAKAGEEDEGGR